MQTYTRNKSEIEFFFQHTENFDLCCDTFHDFVIYLFMIIFGVFVKKNVTPTEKWTNRL